jgi:hypothetical protein
MASLASSGPKRLVMPRSSTSGVARGGPTPPRAGSAAVTRRPWSTRPAPSRRPG